jgi:hypothetical protein
MKLIVAASGSLPSIHRPHSSGVFLNHAHMHPELLQVDFKSAGQPERTHGRFNFG